MINTRYICKSINEVKIVCSYLKIDDKDWISAFEYSISLIDYIITKKDKQLSINHINNIYTHCTGYCDICHGRYNKIKCTTKNYDVINANTLMREHKLKRILK